MKKLAAARAAILAAPLEIKAENLLTFAEKGTVQSWRGDRNLAFRVTYTAHLIVTDYARAPQDLLFVALDWLHRDNPGATEDAVRFHVDIIDHGKADVSLAIDLTEIVATEDTAEGLRLAPTADPDAAGFDMGTLFPTLPAAPAAPAEA